MKSKSDKSSLYESFLTIFLGASNVFFLATDKQMFQMSSLLSKEKSSLIVNTTDKQKYVPSL